MSNPVTFLAGAINNKEPIGVAILVAFNDKTDDRFNRGLQKDIEKMSNVFTELKFVVCVCKQMVADVKSIIRAASMYNEYPDSLQYICFYTLVMVVSILKVIRISWMKIWNICL